MNGAEWHVFRGLLLKKTASGALHWAATTNPTSFHTSLGESVGRIFEDRFVLEAPTGSTISQVETKDQAVFEAARGSAMDTMGLIDSALAYLGSL